MNIINLKKISSIYPHRLRYCPFPVAPHLRHQFSPFHYRRIFMFYAITFFKFRKFVLQFRKFIKTSGCSYQYFQIISLHLFTALFQNCNICYFIITVQKIDKLSLCKIQPLISGCRNSFILLINNNNPVIFLFPLFNYTQRTIRRTIVHTYHFYFGVPGITNRFQTLCDIFFHIVTRYNNT